VHVSDETSLTDEEQRELSVLWKWLKRQQAVDLLLVTVLLQHAAIKQARRYIEDHSMRSEKKM
jgi:hypothetical protein